MIEANRASSSAKLVSMSTLVCTPVSAYMTAAPEVLRPDSELAEAAHTMLQLGVRHLPVLQGGRLVGVLSMRDVLGAEAGGP
jgi:CBS domain-containing protein